MADKYTYADVIIDPNDPRVEVDAEYYYCDNLSGCLERANKDDVAHLAGLEKVCPNIIGHFFIDDAYSICLIRKKEPVKRYVPFDLSDSEVRKSLRDRWVTTIDGTTDYPGDAKIVQFYYSETSGWLVCIGGESGESVRPDYLLKKYKFDDGSPCGKLVEEEE